jgi:hypothetical protein
MNERIKHLAEQTSYIWHASGDPQIYEFTPEKLEKFAELIVDECCLKLLDMDEKTNGRHNYYKHAALELKRHVGVKE